ncbi:diguanylate cyclase [Rhabdochromatium marinum]|uniref:GGDEF domain-containing response regulator n=1 Tax=Rhabdochromatium marinum TaxID=48729 RepID=UPI001906491A|nr:diguanylate cyclase [Rhabdochromatium marinum]MBK1648717.1 diguanylate cyclase response regulator [Rhabdochromatium marinum]
MTQSAILCVDDEPMVISALRTLLEQHLKEVQVIEVAELAAEALEVVDELLSDGIELKVVVADYIMPQMRGDELLVRIHRRLPRIKKILLTGQSDIGGVKQAINEADLYRFIEKPWQNEDLLLTLRGALTAYDQERELERQNEELRRLNEELELKVAARTRELAEKNRELEQLSVTDRLTGLYNRLKLDEELERELLRAKRYGTPFAILLLDIDRFKRVNDTHGHQMGDRVLIELANILRRTIRDTDWAGRWGGEEFLIICPETALAGAAHLAEKQRAEVAAHRFPVSDCCGASFGVSAYREGDCIESLLARADAALYRAKEGGRNRVEVEQTTLPNPCPSNPQ